MNKPIKSGPTLGASVETRFRGVCNLCSQLKDETRPVRTSSRYAQLARQLLETFGESLRRAIPSLATGSFKIEVSRGQGYLPRVLWVAIVPLGNRVSQHPCVAICFGRQGEGAVGGLMNPASIGGAKLVGVTKHKLRRMHVDVDGKMPSTIYSDKFVNPKEFLVDDVSGQAIISHVRRSLNHL